LEYRSLGETGMRVSEVSLGTRAFGGEGIPGAKHRDQVEDNLAAAEICPLFGGVMDRIRQIYDRYISSEVHHRW
jgi:aryl-alcohol dehydrogenase-like predicted oxidoreductase